MTGQQLIVVAAFITNEKGELFSPRRAESKKFLPGKFELSGGHVDYGEDLITALKRELMEEFSAEIEVGDCFYAFTYMNDVKQAHSVEILYFAKFITPETEIKIKPDEHSEYRWLDKKQADEVLTHDEEYEAIMKGFEILAKQKGG